VLEVAYSKILPALRGILSHKLAERGLSQRKIAHYLGVTQPLISKLLKKPLESYYAELEKAGVSRDLVEGYAEVLVDLATSGEYARFVATSYSVVNQLAARALCSRADLKSLCYSGLLVDPDVEFYKSVLFRVLGISGLAKVIPEVGSNLAYAPKPPASTSDIVGLTGGIARVAGGVTFYGEPMFGGSRHVARVLLVASKYNPKLRFCMNVKCSGFLERALVESGVRVESSGPHLSPEDFWTGIEEAARNKPNIICDYGGLGLEPVAYVFAISPDELVSLLELVVRVWG
jgi:predicted fused transcriptional regulator/phosphomethylpyrimidine kinase/predicted transcriptional regulator